MGTQDDNEDRVQFMRTGTGDVELRYWCSRACVDVLDAVVMARGGQSANIHRGTVLNEIMAAWVEAKRHEAMLIHRVAGLNPTGSERSVQDLLRVVNP